MTAAGATRRPVPAALKHAGDVYRAITILRALATPPAVTR
jgi:hypothetical protein